MVDALASDRSDQPFGEAVLPRRAWGDGLVADPHGAQSVRDGSAIDAIPIADHVARRLSPRECFGDLACDPVRGPSACPTVRRCKCAQPHLSFPKIRSGEILAVRDQWRAVRPTTGLDRPMN